jgi:hypothetical protein
MVYHLEQSVNLLFTWIRLNMEEKKMYSFNVLYCENNRVSIKLANTRPFDLVMKINPLNLRAIPRKISTNQQECGFISANMKSVARSEC